MSRSRKVAAGLAAVLLAVSLVGPASGSEPAGAITATVTINPLTVELDLPDRPVRAGQRVQVRATVRNLGAEVVQDVVATLHVSEAQVVVRDGVERDLGTIRGGQQARTGWQVCSEQPDVYLLLVRVDATLDGHSIATESVARLLQVADPPGRRPPRCSE